MLVFPKQMFPQTFSTFITRNKYPFYILIPSGVYV